MSSNWKSHSHFGYVNDNGNNIVKGHTSKGSSCKAIQKFYYTRGNVRTSKETKESQLMEKKCNLNLCPSIFYIQWMWYIYERTFVHFEKCQMTGKHLPNAMLYLFEYIINARQNYGIVDGTVNGTCKYAFSACFVWARNKQLNTLNRLNYRR